MTINSIDILNNFVKNLLKIMGGYINYIVYMHVLILAEVSQKVQPISIARFKTFKLSVESDVP